MKGPETAQVVIDCEIEGYAPLLQNNPAGSPGVGKVPKKSTRETQGIKDDPQEWKGKLYEYEGDGKKHLGHPSAGMKRALVDAARNFKADRRRSMKDVVKSVVFLDNPWLELVGKTKPDCVNKDSVVNPVTKGRGFSYRPQFDKGWKMRFALTLAEPDVVSVEQLKEMLDFAGRRIGIGDHRPEFGRFYVTGFKERK